MSPARSATPVGRPAAASAGPPPQQPGMPQPGTLYGMQPAWGGPPKKSKTGLIVGVVAGGVVVLTIAVIGIVVIANSGGPTTGSLARSAISDLNAGKSSALYAKYCSPPDSILKEDVDGAMSGGASVTVDAEDSDDDSFLYKDVSGTVNGKPITNGSIAVQEEGDRDCIENISLTLPDPEPNDALPSARKLASAVNGGDTSTISEMTCPDAVSSSNSELDGASIRVVNAESYAGDDVKVMVTGRSSDDEYNLSSDSYLTMQSKDVGKTWCLQSALLMNDY